MTDALEACSKFGQGGTGRLFTYRVASSSELSNLYPPDNEQDMGFKFDPVYLDSMKLADAVGML